MIFLKLGGSLITDKAGVELARIELIKRLAQEIAEGYRTNPKMKLLLGHGSGSFGHPAAQQFGTHKGARNHQDWLGFNEVGAAANRLHQIVLNALIDAGLPAISFPPSNMVITTEGEINAYFIEPIRLSLENELLPVVYGDVSFDTTRGASIVSTEQVLAHLAKELHPHRILLAGKTAGILTESGEYLQEFRSKDLGQIQFHEPEGADVTGGMESKVQHALTMATSFPEMEVLIFSAEISGILIEVLRGGTAGTRVIAG
jgi:isopentenyl phosphate kinase